MSCFCVATNSHVWLNTDMLQEHVNPTPQHADYRPDMTSRDDQESDYEAEEDDQGGPEDDYDDYHQNNQMD